MTNTPRGTDNTERNKAMLELAKAGSGYGDIAEQYGMSPDSISKILRAQGYITRRTHYSEELKLKAVQFYIENKSSFVKAGIEFDIPAHVVRAAVNKYMRSIGAIKSDNRMASVDKSILIDDESLPLVKRVQRYFHRELLSCNGIEGIAKIRDKFEISHNEAEKLYRNQRHTYVGASCHVRTVINPIKSIAYSMLQ